MMGCDRCDRGWVHVKEGYVDHFAPLPDVLPPELAGDPGMAAAHDLLVRDVGERRASLANSVYPCKDCLPAAFYRWVGGHLSSDHNRAGCDECIELDRRSSRPGRQPRDLVRDGPAPLGPPGRADLDF